MKTGLEGKTHGELMALQSAAEAVVAITDEYGFSVRLKLGLYGGLAWRFAAQALLGAIQSEDKRRTVDALCEWVKTEAGR